MGKQTGRRRFLSTVAGLGAAVGSQGIVSSAVATKDSNKSYRNVNSPDIVQEGSAGLKWYDRWDHGCIVDYLSAYDEGEWFHKWGFSSAAYSATTGVGGGTELYGHEYVADPHGSPLYKETTDATGVTPNGDAGSIPDWAIPLMENAIGNATPGSGWIQAGGKAIEEAFGPASEEANEEVYHYKNQDNTPGEFKGWNECGHYAKFIAQDPEPTISVKFSYQDADTWADEHWSSWEADIDFGDCGPRGNYCNQANGRISDPKKMSSEEKDRLGVTRVNEDEYHSTQKVPQINGSSPEYIATNFPVTVKNVRRTGEWKEK